MESIVRPTWLTDTKETNYKTTQKGASFIRTKISRKAVAAYISNIIEHSEKDVQASVCGKPFFTKLTINKILQRIQIKTKHN